jgi:uncharacterized membrane protein YbjE (DUF340 family)
LKTSFYILFAFVAGVMLGKLAGEPSFITYSNLTFYVLMVLLFLVGVDFGSDPNLLGKLKNTKWKTAFFPLIPIAGTWLGCFAYLLIFPKQPFRETMAIGTGLGFYSLAGAMVTSQSGAVYGTLTVLVNLIRELLTLTMSPVFVRIFGAWAPIASGGATSMDTTLPVVARFSGDAYVIPSVYNGVVLTLAVPFLLSLVYLLF